MSINMTGVPFDTDIKRLELPSQTKSQPGKVRRIGKGPAKSQLPLENAIRPGKPAPCQRRGGHATFRSFSQVQTLNHRALLATGKFHQPPGIRAAIPSAWTILFSSSPKSRPAATAAPKVPVDPGAWKPRFSSE